MLLLKAWQGQQGSQKQCSEEEQDWASREPPQTILADLLSQGRGQATPRGKGAAIHERSIWMGEVASWEGEAESLRPQGTWQHLNLGQEGP